MREELFEEILSLVEEFINELDDETVRSVYPEREKRYKEAKDRMADAPEDKKEEAEKEVAKEGKKLDRYKELAARRALRHSSALADFKERLLNRKPQKASVTDKAGSDHANAIIDQHLRNKLEKTFSNECLEEIISLIEGKVIDFQEKRRDKILDKNAQEFARMAREGELEAVRILPNGEFMGDPHYVDKINKIKKENEEVIGKCRKHG